MPTNILGTPLECCCRAPMTGFHRDGFCRTAPEDAGQHTVCAVMTEEFLAFTRSRGNDLSTPRPEFDFPGLRPGDRWCICVLRWAEALEANAAPPVIPEACSIHALEFVSREALESHRMKSPE